MADRKPLYLNLDTGYPTEVNSADNLSIGKLVALGVGGVGADLGGNTIANLGAPQAASDAATKAYCDNISQGITLIPSVRVMGNANLPLTGLPTVDGVQLVAGDRILLTAQTNPVTNGVWELAASGSWTRPKGTNGVSDWTTGRDASSLAMFVREGAAFGDQGYTCITDGNPKIDTDPVLFTQYTGLGEVITGNGLQKQAASGNQIAIALATASGLTFTGGGLDHLLDPAGAISKSAAGLALKPNANNTVAVDAQGLRTLGVPASFTIAGAAVDASFTAPNASTLTTGPGSLADALHTHQNVLESQSNVSTFKNGTTPLAAGDPVQWSSTADTLGRCDAAAVGSSQCIGVALTAIPANGTGKIVKRGLASGVLSQATPGAPVYLNNGGGLTSNLNTASGGAVVRIGYAKNATDCDVFIDFIGQRSAS